MTDRPTEVRPRFKSEPKKKRKASKRARPGEPMRWQCEFDDCSNPATERHHVKRRSQGGTDDVANTRDLCGIHHNLVHANPEWSYLNGYLMRSST